MRKNRFDTVLWMTEDSVCHRTVCFFNFSAVGGFSLVVWRILGNTQKLKCNYFVTDWSTSICVLDVGRGRAKSRKKSHLYFSSFSSHLKILKLQRQVKGKDLSIDHIQTIIYTVELIDVTQTFNWIYKPFRF